MINSAPAVAAALLNELSSAQVHCDFRSTLQLIVPEFRPKEAVIKAAATLRAIYILQPQNLLLESDPLPVLCGRIVLQNLNFNLKKN